MAAKGGSSLFSLWSLPLPIAILLYGINKFLGKTIKHWLFASFWKRAMIEYHSAMREMKRSHFDSMHKHKSTNANLEKPSLLRVLEIGAGSGANFEFFPTNCKLMVVEPNAFFEPLFYENQSKYPNVKMDKFVVGSAEDMKDIEDNSVDIVVSTLVLCSVGSVERTLKEVHRVLAPGGKFYYWEHVHDSSGTWLHTIQNLLSPLWGFLFDGCNLNRSIDQIVVGSKVFSQVDQKRFDVPLRNGLWRFIRVHVMGVATK